MEKPHKSRNQSADQPAASNKSSANFKHVTTTATGSQLSPFAKVFTPGSTAKDRRPSMSEPAPKEGNDKVPVSHTTIPRGAWEKPLPGTSAHADKVAGADYPLTPIADENFKMATGGVDLTGADGIMEQRLLDGAASSLHTESAVYEPYTSHSDRLVSLQSCLTSKEYCVILHFAIPPNICTAANDKFFVRIFNAKVNPLCKYADGLFWTCVQLRNGSVSSFRYEAFYVRRKQKEGYFAVLGSFMTGESYERVEEYVSGGTASLLQHRLRADIKFKGIVFCLDAANIEMQVTKFLGYVCGQRDFELDVPLRDFVALFFGPKKQDLFDHIAYLEQARTHLTVQQTSHFALVAATCIGALHKANPGRFPSKLLNVVAFPSADLLRSLTATDETTLKEATLKEAAVSGVSHLIRHNLEHNLSDLAWLEKAANDEYLAVVVASCKDAYTSLRMSHVPLARDVEATFVAIMGTFSFTKSKIEMLSWLFLISSDSVNCKEAVLNCFFATARCFKTKRCFTAEASTQYNALIRELSVSDLFLAARVAKGHYPTTDTNDAVIAPLKDALILRIAHSTLVEVRTITVDNCNDMFLNEAWVNACFDRINIVNAHNITLLFDSVLIVFLDLPQNLPGFSLKWVEHCLRGQRDDKQMVLDTVKTVLAARMLVQSGLRWMKVTAAAQVLALEVQVLDSVNQLLHSINVAPWDCIQCVSGLADLIRPINGEVLSLSNHVVAWLSDKMTASLAQQVNDSSYSMRVLNEIDCRNALTCEFSVAVVVVFLDLLTKRMPARLLYCDSYVDVMPVSSIVQVMAALRDMVSLEQMERHAKFAQIKAFVDKIFKAILGDNIFVADFLHIKAVGNNGGGDWKVPLVNFAKAYAVDLTQETLHGCEQSIAMFQTKLQKVRLYLVHVQLECKEETEAGFVTVALAELNRLCSHLEDNIGALSVEQVRSDDVWGRLRDLVPLAEEFSACRGSKLYESIWCRELRSRIGNEEVSDSTDLESESEKRDAVSQLVALCSDVNNASEACLDGFLKSFANFRTLKIGDVAHVWVTNLVFDEEYQALGKSRLFRDKLEHFHDRRYLLQALSDMYAMRDYASGLLDVFQMFEGVMVDDSSYIVRVTNDLVAFDYEADDALLENMHLLNTRFHAAVTQLTGHNFGLFVGLLRELRLCSEVMSFLHQLRDEKNVNLIDMVEDNSDSIVRPETVAEFDSIRRSFRELLVRLADRRLCSPEDFVRDLTECLLIHQDSDAHLAAKLYSCRSQIHSIRDIWFSVANREESSKKLCRKINDTGEAIWCRTETSEFVLVVTCRNADDVLEYKDQVSVEELRSRALLLVNTAHKAFDVEEDEAAAAADREQLRTFINTVTSAMQVTQTLSELIKLGHFDYQKPLIKTRFGVNELTELLRTILGHKNQWEQQLNTLRAQQYFTNYFFSTQFWQLHKYFSGQSLDVAEGERHEALKALHALDLVSDAVDVSNFFAVRNAETTAAEKKKVVALLKYVDSDFTEDKCLLFENCYKLDSFATMVGDADGTVIGYLKVLGHALDHCFSTGRDIENRKRIVADEPTSVSVVKYRDNSGLISLLFGVYTTGFKRSQLLICESNTSHEEMSMFLMRVYSGGLQVSSVSTTYAVINLHKLSHNDRASFMRLMTAAKNSRHAENTNNLVLLLRDDIASCVDGMKLPATAGVTPRQEIDIRGAIKAYAPHVEVVLSAAAGMGKTEYCATEAMKVGKRLHTVLVTDGMSRRDLVQQMQAVELKPHHCLHLDMSNLTHESDIAVGLLELLFLGTSQIDTTVVHRDVKALCFVERANKVSNQHSVEVDSLRYFPTRQLTWSPAAVEIKLDRDSDIQVVCNYLLLLERDNLAAAELIFPGKSEHEERPVTAVVVSPEECHRLLNKYFVADLKQAEIPSANVLLVFLQVLAVQLRRFSSSGQFVVQYMTDPTIRSAVVANMVVCSRDFATRSVVHARKRQKQHEANGGGDNGEEFNECEGLLRWEDNDQTMVCIANNSLALLYKKLANVDRKLVTWYNIQAYKKEDKLADYYAMSSDMLRARLSNFCGLLKTYDEYPNYVLTPDNFLKCVMILLRVQAGVPVIVMGEAGCGKTSLVRFIGEMCNASIQVMSIHAGWDRAAITKKISAWIKIHGAEIKATGVFRQLWIFLDEINTCGELGFINSVVCHRTLPGVRIPKFVSFFAACNPFKRRTLGVTKSVGLSTKTLAGHVNKGDGLVYRVKPLPETMLDYIWDFGSLSGKDEKQYITTFIGQLAHECSSDIVSAIWLLVELVAISQTFIREYYTDGTVSMRDVRRVKLLFTWFLEHKLPFSLNFFERNYELKKAHKCIVLALTQCYRCRLPSAELRTKYDKAVSQGFESQGVSMKETDIRIIIHSEQEGYLKEMTVPEGIALNDSLVENVFVLLVCILNKIPVFIVGKPGSSKSLSIVLINSNMRGKDSDSTFFRSLPEVKIICFQGSESSTSEGILKIFAKAKGFVSNEDDVQSKNVIPVVLIDEIGLAEISPFNPLKVLHSQLETDDDKPLDIAVIGISNWELDLSKMSRAVYLARPEPDLSELCNTAITIVQTIYGHRVPRQVEEYLFKLSGYYIAFCASEEIRGHANFHGLRDFYSTCKFLGHVLKESHMMNSVDVKYALLRNFGGLPLHLKDSAFKPIFGQAEVDQSRLGFVEDMSVSALVYANLRDKNARHLMLISEGDSIMNVLSDLFEAAGVTKYRVIIGSKFRGDKSENYRYRMLSEIILCMERGESLALRDMDDIYQSLYDMLNQNYTIVAGKKNCRIALGAFSNPVAHIHDDFKCIVMPDAKKVYSLDPPFLNRFEKHIIDFQHALLPMHHKVVKALEVWVEFMCQIQGGADLFTDRDTFVGFSSTGTLSSLVLTVVSQSQLVEESEVLLASKQKLMGVATFQGVVRALSSQQAKFNTVETRQLFDSYIADKRHISLKHFVEHTLHMNALPSKSIVSTYSNFYFLDVAAHKLPPSVVLAYSKLSAFDTELELCNFVREYFVSPKQNMLILQCDVAVDSDKLMMTKFVIDKEMRAYKESCDASATGGDEPRCCTKHVIQLLHTKSELYEDDRLSGLDLYFSADWENFHIDNLEQDDDSWTSVQRVIVEKQTLPQYLDEHSEVFNSCFGDLLSCFRHIKYLNDRGDSQQRILDLCTGIKLDSPALQHLLRDKVMQTMMADPQYQTDGWLLRVALARENLEFSSSSLAVAVTSYAVSVVRGYLSQCVYLFEKYSAFGSYLSRALLPEYERNVFLTANELSLANVGAASGPECYEVNEPCEGLQCAFSALLIERMGDVKAEYMDAVHNGCLDERRYDNFMSNIAAVIDAFSRDTNTTGCFNQRLFCDDAVRLFIHKTSNDSAMSYNVVEHVVKSLMDLLNCTDTTVNVLCGLLWGSSSLIVSMVALIQPTGERDSALQVASTHKVQELLETHGASPNTKVMDVAVFALCVDFCNEQWSVLTGQPFSLTALSEWCVEVQGKLPHFVIACQEVQFVFEFGFLHEDFETEFSVFNAQLMPFYLNLLVIIDLCNLLRKSFGEEIPQECTHLLTLLTDYFANAHCAMSSECLDSLMTFTGLLAAELPTKSSNLLATFKYKTLKRFLLLPVVGENDTSMAALLASTVYTQAGRCLTMDASAPPLVCRELVSILVEKLVGALFDISEHEVVLAERGEQGILVSLSGFDEVVALAGMTPSINAFEALFLISDSNENLISASGSQLETMMTDMLCECLGQVDLELNDDDACDTFAALITRWETHFDSLALVERMLGVAFCRVFLDNVAAQLSANDDLSDELSQTLQNTLGADKPHLLFHVCRIYVLKALRLPQQELKLACIDGGWLHAKARWVEKYAWQPAKLVSRLLPVGAQAQDTTVKLAWDEMNHQYAPSDEKMTALLASVPDGDSEVFAGLVSAAFAAKCRTAAPNSVAADVTPILDSWPAGADVRWKALFQAVHSRFTTPCMLPVSDFDVDDVCLLNIVTSLMNMKSPRFVQNVFVSYMSDADVIKSTFVMGAHSSDLAAVMRAHGDGIGYYRCACGYVYEIGDCKLPGGAEANCKCGRTLGGHNHAFTDTSTQKVELNTEDPRGYHFPAEYRAAEDYSVRGLTRNESRILSLLVHSCLLIGLYTSPEQFSIALNMDADKRNEAVAMCWDWMKANWAVLCNSMAIEGDRKELLCALLMQLVHNIATEPVPSLTAVFTSSVMRSDGEFAFSAICSALMNDFASASLAAFNKWVEPASEAAFEREIQERDAPITFMPKCFRLLRAPSIDDVRNAYLSSAATMLKYPLIGIYFKYEADLHRIRDLLPLMKWPTTLRTFHNFEFAITDIEVSAADVLSKDARLSADEYKAFEDAWNNFCAVSKQVNEDQYFDRLLVPDCHTVTIKPLTASDSILYSCVRLSHIGKEVPYMCHTLGQIQNKFLAAVYAARPDCERKDAETKNRRLHEATNSDVIVHDSAATWKHLMRFVRADLNYGAGTQLECDWELIEAALKARLVDNKVMLRTAILEEGSLQLYRYKHEMFQDQVDLFARLHELVPQDNALPDADAIRADSALSDVGVVDTKLFPALDNLIFMLLKQRKATLRADQTLLEFAKAHLDNDAHWQQLETRKSAVVSLTLTHIEALYEIMEDAISTTVIGCLDAKFRMDINAQLLTDVFLLLVPLAGDIKALEGIVRRFILRYLRNPDAKKPTDPLYFHLTQMRWPGALGDITDYVDSKQELEAIFHSLCVGHLGTLQQALQQRIEAAAEYERRQQMRVQQDQGLQATAATAADIDQGVLGTSNVDVSDAGRTGQTALKKAKKPQVRPKGMMYSM